MGCLRTHLPWVFWLLVIRSFDNHFHVVCWELRGAVETGACFSLSLLLPWLCPLLGVPFTDSAGHSRPSPELAVGLQVGHLPL